MSESRKPVLGRGPFVSRRQIIGKGVALVSVASICTFESRPSVGAPPLTQEAERIQSELEADLPRGSDEAAIQAAFRKRGWEPMFDAILNNYGFLIKKNTGKDGILVRVWLDKQKRSSKIEVKAIYSPDLG